MFPPRCGNRRLNEASLTPFQGCGHTRPRVYFATRTRLRQIPWDGDCLFVGVPERQAPVSSQSKIISPKMIARGLTGGGDSAAVSFAPRRSKTASGRRFQARGSAPWPWRSAAIELRDPVPHWDAQKQPDTRDHGSWDRRQELSMSNVDYARSRRVGGIVSFVIFTFECARRYYNVSWWPDQNWSAWGRGPIRHR